MVNTASFNQINQANQALNQKGIDTFYSKPSRTNVTFMSNSSSNKLSVLSGKWLNDKNSLVEKNR